MEPCVDSILAGAVRTLLDGVAVGAEISPSAARDHVASILERFVPQVLGDDFSAWQRESLDAVYPSSCRKSASHEVEVLGICCIMSTQSLAPLWLRLSIDARADSIVAADVRLGVRGSDPLGLRDTPYVSPDSKRFHALCSELASPIDWAFRSNFLGPRAG